MPELYGRGALLHGLVPRLVGVRYDDGRSVTPEFRAGGPVVELVGGRYSGKTAITQHLYKAYGQRIPLSRVDPTLPGFGHPGLGQIYTPGATGTANTSPVADLLYFLDYQLRRRPARFGRPLEFPRLVHGLTAVSSWQAGSAEELASARARLDGLLTADRGMEPGAVEAWLNAVIDLVGALTGMDSMVSVARALVSVVTDTLFKKRVNKAARSWWAERGLTPNGDGLDQLEQLAIEFRDVGSGGRERAQQHLVSALLADVSEHYGPLLTFDGVHRPLVLLDNVRDDGLGTEIMALLLEAHRQFARTGRRNHLVVIATGLGDPAELPGLSTVAHRTGWRPPAPSEDAGAQAWRLTLGITDVGPDEIRSMFRDVRPATHLVDVIARLSGGRAGVAHVLAGAASDRARAGHPLRAEELLTLPADGQGGASVATSLLASLLPDALTRSRLAHYAPALDAPAARHLARSLPFGENDNLAADEARQYLNEEHWPNRPWPGLAGPFVSDPTLRALLLHELRSAPEWDTVHHRLMTYQNPGHPLAATADTADWRYLHHALALGRCDLVVRSLHRRFADADAAAWLTDLNLVCAAPLPRGDAEPTDPAGCSACGSGGQPVHMAIDRLVRGLWAHSAPLAVPDERTIGQIKLDLGVLATNSAPQSHATYFDAYTTWPPLLHKRVQAPELPISGGHGA